MPTLPDKNSFGKRPVADYIRPIVQQQVDQTGTAMVEGGQQLQKFGSNLQDSMDEFDYQKSKADFYSKNVPALDSYELDTDYSTYQQRYTEQATGFKNEALNGVRNPKIKARLAAELDVDITQGVSKLDSLKNAKMLDHAGAEWMGTQDKLMKAFILAKTPEQKAAINQSMVDNAKALSTLGMSQMAIKRDLVNWETNVGLLEAERHKGDPRFQEAVNNRLNPTAPAAPSSAEDWSALDTKLAPAEEAKFQEWKKANAPNDSGADYDLRGAFQEGFKPDPKSGHFPDKYKKPNHPTFSNESKFAKDFPGLAGSWEGEKFNPPKGKSVKLPSFSPEVNTAIETAAAKHNVPAEYMYVTADIESGGKNIPTKVKGASSAGLFQFNNKTANRFGLKDKYDINASADAAARLYNENKADLSKKINRQPTNAEVYLAHQQGGGGAALLLNNPDKPAIEILTEAYKKEYGSDAAKIARQAVLNNGGKADMTAGQFAKRWTDEFTKRAGGTTTTTAVGKVNGEFQFLDRLPVEKLMKLQEQGKAQMAVDVAADFDRVMQLAKMNIMVPQAELESLEKRAIMTGDVERTKKISIYTKVQPKLEGFAVLPDKEALADIASLKKEVDANPLLATETGLYYEWVAKKDIYATKQKAKVENPWGFYVGHGVVEQPEELDFTAGSEALKAQIQKRKVSAELIKNKDGNQVGLLQEHEIAQLQNVLETAKPQDAGSQISYIGSLLGDDKSATLNQLMVYAKTDEDKKEVNTLMAAMNMDAKSATILINGNRSKGIAPTKDVTSSIAAEIGNAIPEAVSRDRVINSIYDYYKGLELKTGATEFDKDLMKTAIDSVIGMPIELGTSKVFSFKDMDGKLTGTTGAMLDDTQLENILYGITDDVLLKTGGAPARAKWGKVKAEDIKKSYQFISDGDGVYLAVDDNGEYLMNGASGNAYRFDARRIGRELKAQGLVGQDLLVKRQSIFDRTPPRSQGLSDRPVKTQYYIDNPIPYIMGDK